MQEKAIVMFECCKAGIYVDLEIPLNISARDLYTALNDAYHLKQNDNKDDNEVYLKCENPIALLKGDRKLHEYGLHNGTKVFI